MERKIHYKEYKINGIEKEKAINIFLTENENKGITYENVTKLIKVASDVQRNVSVYDLVVLSKEFRAYRDEYKNFWLQTCSDFSGLEVFVEPYSKYNMPNANKVVDKIFRRYGQLLKDICRADYIAIIDLGGYMNMNHIEMDY